MISSIQDNTQSAPYLYRTTPDASFISSQSNAPTDAENQIPSAGTDMVSLSDAAQQLSLDALQTSTSSNIATAFNAPDVVPVGDEAPHYVKTVQIPDGQDVLQLGNADGSKDYFHKQGNNDLGYQGDCGLVSAGDVANQFGVNVSENDVVHYAADNGLCTTSGPSDQQGATTLIDQEKVLNGLGVSSHIEEGNTLEGLGRELEDGHGAIIEVNAGDLWNNPKYYDSGNINHAVTVTGVAVDPVTGQAKGIWIDDSGTGQYDRYVQSDNTAVQGWLQNGSPSVVTDAEHY